MYQRRLRRKSVLIDVHLRIENLVQMVESLNSREKVYERVDKVTLIDYLNLTKILMQKEQKVSHLDIAITKVAIGTDLHKDANLIFNRDRQYTEFQDAYMRTAGIFSAFLSCDELWSRVVSLPDQIRHTTNKLIACVHAYAQNVHSYERSAGMENTYVDALNDFDANIGLLQFVDDEHLESALEASSIDADGMRTISMAMTSIFTALENGPKKSNFSHLFQDKKNVQIQQILTCIKKLKKPSSELQCERHVKSILANVPFTVTISRLTNNDIQRRLNLSKDSKEAPELLLNLMLTILNGLAVISAFRTVLFSKELQAMRGDWSFSDITGFEDIEQMFL